MDESEERKPANDWVHIPVLLTVGSFCAYWWYWHIPVPSKAVLWLAGAAVVMALWEMRPIHKAGYLLLVIWLMFIENRAVDKDREATAKAQGEAINQIGQGFTRVLTEQQTSFAKTFQDNQTNFSKVLAEQQSGFHTMLANALETQRKQNEQFAKVLDKERELFSAQQQLFPALNGQLIATDDASPDTMCGKLDKDQYLVALHQSGFVFKQLPHTIVMKQMADKVIWLEQKIDGTLILYMNIVSDDGRIAVRLDKDGFYVNPRSTFIARRPDISTILIQDDFGHDLVKVRYANPKTFVISGLWIDNATRTMDHFCMKGSDNELTDISIR
jgi:hypothetical protein